jgi:retron-type reverse transcriptase
MKRHGGLWEHVVRWDNLLLAARKAQRGKRHRAVVQRFNFFREWELLRLQRELEDGRYCPGPFRSHWIDRPKRRMISAAPYRDRVVHHALMNVLEPILDRRFHPHSYACRKGKGTHAAADRLQNLMRRRRYALQCDIRKFFPSIDHLLLKATCRRFVKDSRVLGLLDRIIDHSNEQEAVREWFPGDDLWTPWERRRGLPIGNLTSQWLANAYLDDLDQFVTARLGVGAYVRYCDDFVLLHDDRGRLRAEAAAVADFLAARRLRLHEGKQSVTPARSGLTFVGYRIWPTHRLLPKSNVRRLRRRVRWMKRALTERRIGREDVRLRLAGWIGHALRANSGRLLLRLSGEWVFG